MEGGAGQAEDEQRDTENEQQSEVGDVGDEVEAERGEGEEAEAEEAEVEAEVEAGKSESEQDSEAAAHARAQRLIEAAAAREAHAHTLAQELDDEASGLEDAPAVVSVTEAQARTAAPVASKPKPQAVAAPAAAAMEEIELHEQEKALAEEELRRQQFLAEKAKQQQSQQQPQKTSETSSAVSSDAASTPITVKQPRRAADLLAFDDLTVSRPNADNVHEALRSTRRATTNVVLMAAQRSRELFSSSAARRDLVTTDEDLQDSVTRLQRHAETSKNIKALLEKYMKQMDALTKAENDLSQYLQVEGVRSPSVVGSIMTNMGQSLKTVGDHRQRFVRPAVQSMHNNVTLLSDHVFPDVEATVSKIDKARVSFDAHKNNLQAHLGSGKTLPPAKEAELRERMDIASQEYDRLKRDTNTKVLMAEDHRLRMFNSMLEDYQSLMKTHFEKASNTLHGSVARQKLEYETMVGGSAVM